MQRSQASIVHGRQPRNRLQSIRHFISDQRRKVAPPISGAQQPVDAVPKTMRSPSVAAEQNLHRPWTTTPEIASSPSDTSSAINGERLRSSTSRRSTASGRGTEDFEISFRCDGTNSHRPWTTTPESPASPSDTSSAINGERLRASCGRGTEDSKIFRCSGAGLPSSVGASTGSLPVHRTLHQRSTARGCEPRSRGAQRRVDAALKTLKSPSVATEPNSHCPWTTTPESPPVHPTLHQRSTARGCEPRSRGAQRRVDAALKTLKSPSVAAEPNSHRPSARARESLPVRGEFHPRSMPDPGSCLYQRHRRLRNGKRQVRPVKANLSLDAQHHRLVLTTVARGQTSIEPGISRQPLARRSSGLENRWPAQPALTRPRVAETPCPQAAEE